MAKTDLIGVVTVTYNSGKVLPDFLRCMAEQTHHEFLLFAVDNASTDDTTLLLRECADERLRVIANPDNRGVAAGNNQGITAALEAGCHSVLLINNDTEFDSSLIAQLHEGLATHHVEMICPKIMYFGEPNRIWAAGGTFQPWLGYNSIHFGEGETDRGQYDCARLVTYVPTCCVLIEAKVFESVGLMDERYFAYVDDVDFMYRAMKAGIKLLYLPEATLLHKVGRLTGGADSPFAIRYGTRNRIFFMLKHFGLIPTLPWLAIRQIAWMLALVLGKKNLDWYRIKNEALRNGLRMHRNSVQEKVR